MTDKELIAIIGIGCRFPGGAKDPDSFWQLLLNGIDAITEVPADRFNINDYYDPRPQTPGKVITRCGGFIDELDKFDADFFGIAPVEVEQMDPQQRLLLEVSWEALEDAGIPASRISGTATGVFIGSWLQDFESRLVGNPTEDDLCGIELYTTTGSGRYPLAGRLSFFYDLIGPSLLVDTHCSSSLVAVHLACQSIWQAESEIAIAGGVNVILSPYVSVAYAQSGIIAPDGRCKFGDAQANGYVRSEGCGLVVLKPYSQAVEDGDHIYAVISGSAVNNDGRSSGFLTTPGQGGQRDVLRKAYCRAGISPVMVQYIEAHGTGTPTGDPVELMALGAVLGDGRKEGDSCLVGSVKTNIGHTEGAAGVAGLIKLALAIKNGEIPASLHFHQPNPQIPWESIPLNVNTDKLPWPDNGSVRIGGVSSFGITGTNAHAVLQEAPAVNSSVPLEDEHSTYLNGGNFLFPISAQSPEALRDRVSGMAAWLKQIENSNEAVSIEDICATAALRRDHLNGRMAFVADSISQLQEGLSASLQEEVQSAFSYNFSQISGKPKVVFVFPGQGSQYPGMCQKLMEQSAVFRESIERCDHALKPFCDWSLLDQLRAGAKFSRQDEIDVVQPVLFSIQIALSAQWRAWGIEPDAVVGHSMGEAAAAFVCGALTLETAAKVITKRSQLMKRTSGQGAMALIELTIDQAIEEIGGREKDLSVAVCNSPRSTVLSGNPSVLDEVLKSLETRGVFCRNIKVDVASHSPQMDDSRRDLVAALRGLSPEPSVIPIYSTVTGEIKEGNSLDAGYWGDNLRKPVLFSAAVKRLLESNHTVFIEMSPHPLLLRAIDETFEHLYPSPDSFCAVLPSLVRDKDDMGALLTSLGLVYSAGYPIAWQRLYAQPNRLIKFPSYPWQRKRYWIDEVQNKRRSLFKLNHFTGLPQAENGDIQVEPTLKGEDKTSKIKASLSLREALNSAAPGQPRRLILETYLKGQLAKILMVPSSRLDTGKAFKNFGMDSLGALKFRSRIESDLALRLSATMIWNYPTIKQLAAFLSEKIEIPLEREEGSGGATQGGTMTEPIVKEAEAGALGDFMDELESLTEEEVRKLLENG